MCVYKPDDMSPSIRYKRCYCGSQKQYADCCGAFIAGEDFPSTPLQLMKSRYTAYTLANIDYIEKTQCDQAAEHFNPLDAQRWAQSVKWLGLKIIKAPAVTGDKGTVEFIARYQQQDGEIIKMREHSRFARIDGKWFYVGCD